MLPVRGLLSASLRDGDDSACLVRCSELSHELLGRDVYEGLAHELLDHLPVRLRVEDDADPAARADVGRAEEAVGVGFDQGLLRTDGLRQPDGEMGGAMVVIIEHREHLALAGKPGGLTVGEAFSRLGKREAYLAQAFDERRVPRSDAPNRVCGGILRRRRASSGFLRWRLLHWRLLRWG
jgi:hypothetical protein